ncbi:MAG: VWA domain-containing protein [Lachnospiraceae bacterium]|nr:VWA domain-containing protein [Lachnospiraceae bacterium]
MQTEFKMTYNVDMVFCIDATGSMSPVIDLVKKNALNFYNDVQTVMRKKGKVINSLRVRAIAFRDYLADGDDAMLLTNFFDLPDQADDFSRCIKSIRATGGGDEPEDGLEALGYAIKSKWNMEAKKKRQIIVVWTDASTHEIGYGRSEKNYPQKMARDFSELTSWWGNNQMEGFIDQAAKRLILFAPEAPYWSQVADNWDNVIHCPSQAGKGVAELDYNQIIDTISNTI